MVRSLKLRACAGPVVVRIAAAAALATSVATGDAGGAFDGPFPASDFRKVAASNQTLVPGTAATFSSTRLAGVEGSTAAFLGTYVDPGSGASRNGLFSASVDGTIAMLAGATTLTAGGESITSIIANGEWIDGQITFAANTTAGQRIYRLDTNSGGLTTLIRSGDTVGNSSSAIASFTTRGVAGDNHGYAFSTVLANGTHTLYQSINSAPGSALVVTDSNARSPVPETGNVVDFSEIAYGGGLTAAIPRGLETDRPGGIVEPVGIILATPGNPTRLPAFKRGEIPGSPDADFRFNEFEKARVFDWRGERTVAFTGGFIEEEDPNSDERYMGLFSITDGNWKNWINSDIALPGLRADVEEFNGFGIDEDFFAAGAVDEDGGRYIFAEIDGKFEYVLSTYDTLDGKTISAIRWTTDMMNGAELFFTAEFTDGSNGVFAVVVPEPASLTTIAAAALLLRRRR